MSDTLTMAAAASLDAGGRSGPAAHTRAAGPQTPPEAPQKPAVAPAAPAPDVDGANAVYAAAHRVCLILKALDIIIADKIGIGRRGTSSDDMEVIWELVCIAQSTASEVENAIG